MAIEDYWASTARNAKDVVQYAVYPVVKVGALIATRGNSFQSNLLAGGATSLFYAGLTEIFLGREMTGFDKIAHMALAAELGKKPETIKFSDYLDSNNCVIKKRMALFKKENINRYSASLLPMLPSVMELAARKISPGLRPSDESVKDGANCYLPGKIKHNSRAIDHVLDGWGLWDGIVYAGIALLWLQETFNTDKTFIYQARKEMENNESLALKIGANNMAALFNRMRDDCGMEMIGKSDRDIMWPMYELLAKKMNANPNFGLAELTYLMGLGKLDVFAKDKHGKELKDKDGRLLVDERLWKLALSEIELIERVGLAGIIEEKMKAGEKSDAPNVSFVSRLGRGWLDTHFNVFKAITPNNKTYTEAISPRDTSEVITHSMP